MLYFLLAWSSIIKSFSFARYRLPPVDFCCCLVPYSILETHSVGSKRALWVCASFSKRLTALLVQLFCPPVFIVQGYCQPYLVGIISLVNVFWCQAILGFSPESFEIPSLKWFTGCRRSAFSTIITYHAQCRTLQIPPMAFLFLGFY